MRRYFTVLGLAVIAAFGLSRDATAQESAFYAGKQIRLIVGTGVGGGYDAYARLVARFMPKHIAGEPAIIVQTMPGASGATAVSYLYSNAPRDGLVIATFNSAMPFYQAIGQPGTRFKSEDLSWIGNLSQGVSIFVLWHTAGIKTIADARRTEIIMGGTGTGGNSSAIPVLINSTLGTKFKVVSGYKTGLEVDLAMERGEVQGRGMVAWASTKAVHPDWIKGNKVYVFCQIGLKKDPELADVPLLTELAETDEQREIFKFVSATGNLERPFAGPPGMAPDRLNILRNALMAMTKDAGFLAAIAEQNLELDPLPGEETAKIVSAIVNVSPDIIEKTKIAMTVKE